MCLSLSQETEFKIMHRGGVIFLRNPRQIDCFFIIIIFCLQPRKLENSKKRKRSAEILSQLQTQPWIIETLTEKYAVIVLQQN